jgi:hypothetical protein
MPVFASIGAGKSDLNGAESESWLGQNWKGHMDWNEPAPVIDQVVEDYYRWRAKICDLASEFKAVTAQAERKGGNALWQQARQVFARTFQSPMDGLECFLTPELLEEIEYQKQNANPSWQVSFFKSSAESAFRTLEKLELVFDTKHFRGPVLLAFEAYRDGKGGTLEFVLVADVNRRRLEKLFQEVRDRDSGV